MRTPDDYAKDWNSTKSPKGSEDTGVSGGSYDYGVPYRAEDPETKAWSPQNDGASYGHSSDVEEVDLAKRAGKNLLRDGYERGESDGEGSVLGTRQPDGSFPQALPKSNEYTTHDRSREFSKLEEGSHSGAEGARSSPGRQLIGSRENLG